MKPPPTIRVTHTLKKSPQEKRALRDAEVDAMILRYHSYLTSSLAKPVSALRDEANAVGHYFLGLAEALDNTSDEASLTLLGADSIDSRLQELATWLGDETSQDPINHFLDEIKAIPDAIKHAAVTK